MLINKNTVIKKLLAAATVLMVSTTTLSALPILDSGVVYAASEVGQVTTSLLNVRSGAGTQYSIIGSLAKGKTFTVTGSTKDKFGTVWYSLAYGSKTGYVSSNYVYIKQTSVNTVSNIKGTVKATGGLNVRSGPASAYSRIGLIGNGKTFDITGKAQDSGGVWWYQLNLNGKTGYVHSGYVTVSSSSVQSTPQSTPQTSVASNKVGTVATKTDPLIVRSGPAKSYSKVGTLAKGKTFTITGESKDSSGTVWYSLTYSNKKAYVSSSYVTVKTINQESAPTTSTADTSQQTSSTYKMGTTTASGGLNVRSGPGTSYSKLSILSKGSVVTITGSEKASNGKIWYKYAYTASTPGYICSDYVSVSSVASDGSFESQLTSQGFPDSYKSMLTALHSKHPNWVFKAVNVGYDWNDALSKESIVGKNLVSSWSPVSYRSTVTGAYNSSTGVWTKFDGSWYAANSKVIAHYMDPRNFINESGIYQFMTHKYDSASQNSTTVAAVIKGSFMEGKNPGDGYSNYESLINDVGRTTGVNPNILAAMIIQEQSWNGSSIVSGTYPGYAGYYNFFNVGAYTTSSMNAIQRGLWYASNSGSYSRPWDTPYKSIKGGAEFYAEGYVNNNQYTYYTKKFNVNNGLSSVATHQYMTNVAGASSEGGIVKRAYSANDNYPVIFEIPVYRNMPSSACPLP